MSPALVGLLASLLVAAGALLSCGPKIPPPYYVPCEDEALIKVLVGTRAETTEGIRQAYADCKESNEAKRIRHSIQLERAKHQDGG